MALFLQFLILLALGLVAMIIWEKGHKPEELFPVKEAEERTADPFFSWQTITSRANGFEISMPAMPSESVDIVPLENGGEVVYKTYVTFDPEGTSYLLSVAEYPEDAGAEDPNVYLQTVLRELTKTEKGGEVISVNKIMSQGYPGVDFKMRDGNKLTQARLLMVDHYLYITLYLSLESEFDQAVVDYFIESLNIIPREQ